MLKPFRPAEPGVSRAREVTGNQRTTMFENVVVGVDRHEGGQDAIALAVRLASGSAKLTLAYVIHGNDSAWRGAVPPIEPAERLQAELELHATASEAAVQADVRCYGNASIGKGLHELCELVGADLLVVGSSRRSVVGRILFGNDTRASLNGAPCAIAIAPAGFAHDPIPIARIGVAYNESPESEHALAVARDLAAEHNAKLLALEAVSIPAYALGSGLVPMPLDEWTQSLLGRARDRLSSLDGVQAHAVCGPAPEALVSFSSSVDLLVVGSRGYGPFGRVVYGSTSQRLARSVGCPLLVLTRGARAATTGAAKDRSGAAVSAGA